MLSHAPIVLERQSGRKWETEDFFFNLHRACALARRAAQTLLRTRFGYSCHDDDFDVVQNFDFWAFVTPPNRQATTKEPVKDTSIVEVYFHVA